MKTFGWEWDVPESHPGQPWLEYMVEQAVTVTVLKIAKRAHARGDKVTFSRMGALIFAGAEAEREALRASAEAKREDVDQWLT